MTSLPIEQPGKAGRPRILEIWGNMLDHDRMGGGGNMGSFAPFIDGSDCEVPRCTGSGLVGTGVRVEFLC